MVVTEMLLGPVTHSYPPNGGEGMRDEPKCVYVGGNRFGGF